MQKRSAAAQFTSYLRGIEAEALTNKNHTKIKWGQEFFPLSVSNRNL